jgi:hypothetical protein
MTGGIMPKLFAMRWPIGIGVGLLLIAGVLLSWGSSRPSRSTSTLAAVSRFFTGDEYEGELGELQLLQSALHRINAELRQPATGLGLPSLRAEREAVVQRVRAVAKRMPADSLPPDIRRLIEPEAAPAIAPGPAARPIEEAAPVRATSELQIGLRPPSPVADFSSLALAARPPWPVFLPRPHPRRAAPAAPAADRPDPAETRPSSP